MTLPTTHEARRKPRVGFLWHGDRNIGGGEYSTLSLAEHLRPEYTPVLMYACENHLIERYRAAGIESIKIDVDPRLTSVYRNAVASHARRFPIWTALYVRFVAEVLRTIRRHDIDLLHPVDNLSKLAGGMAARLAHIKVVGHCHDDFGSTPIERTLIACQLLILNRVIATSDTIAARLKRFPAGMRKVARIWNGIDTSVFDPDRVVRAPDVDWDWKAGRVAIGIVAMFDVVKGHRLLFAALRVLKDQGNGGWCCYVVGSGRDEVALHQEVETLGLGDVVRFLGYRQDVPAIMRGLDIVVVPSDRESFGRVAAEAMAMQVPVVATAVGGLSEVVEQGETGILVSPATSHSIAAAIGSLVSDPSRRAAMGSRGRKRVLKLFTVESNARLTKELYDDVLRPISRSSAR